MTEKLGSKTGMTSTTKNQNKPDELNQTEAIFSSEKIRTQSSQLSNYGSMIGFPSYKATQLNDSDQEIKNARVARFDRVNRMP